MPETTNPTAKPPHASGRQLAAVCLAALALGAAALVSRGGQGAQHDTMGTPARAAPLVVRGQHFTVACHFPDASAAAAALAVAEAVWPVAAELYGVPPEARHAAFPVHLYRRPTDYEAAEAKLTRGQFKRNLAFAHWETQTAHVAVQPDLTDAVLERDGLNYQTLRLVAHEAAHLVRFWAMPDFREHPKWFADGNASWIETRVLGARGLLASPEDDPTFSTAVLRVKNLVERDALPSAAALLADEVEALSFYERYAVRWLLFRFLRERSPEALAAVVADMRGEVGPGSRERTLESLRQHFEVADLAQLDGAFRAFVAGLRPRWEQTSRCLETAGSAWLQTAFDDRDARTWSTESTGTGAWSVRGELVLLRDAKGQLEVLAGRSERSLVSVAFTAQRGVTVRRFDADTKRYEVLAERSIRGLEFGKRIGFRVACSAEGQLSVEVHGERVLEVALAAPLRGAWGLGAQRGSSGVWYGVRLDRGP